MERSHQAASFSSFILFAGTETTSNTLGRILHQLALYPDMQNRLRAELREARESSGQGFEYDRLMGLPYLDAICKETLRLCATFISNKHPKLIFLFGSASLVQV